MCLCMCRGNKDSKEGSEVIKKGIFKYTERWRLSVFCNCKRSSYISTVHNINALCEFDSSVPFIYHCCHNYYNWIFWQSNIITNHYFESRSRYVCYHPLVVLCARTSESSCILVNLWFVAIWCKFRYKSGIN